MKMLKRTRLTRLLWRCALLFVCSQLASASAAEKPRAFVLTDIENEPDDAMSMVRFLTYANHFEVEGLAATTSIHQQNRVAPQRIRSIVEAYGKVHDKPGEEVRLSAAGSSDPDGDALSYNWYYYGEAGTLQTSSGTTGQPVAIQDFDQVHASFTVPSKRVMAPGTGTMHIIRAITDHGTPRLTRYLRVIVDVEK